MEKLNLKKNKWIKLNGPFGGYINCLATLNSIIYAGTNNGLFKSVNNGDNWTYVHSEFEMKEISSISLTKDDIFVGTNNGQIFYSINDGASWEELDSGIYYDNIIKSLYDTGKYLFVGTHCKSSNGEGVFRYDKSCSGWIACEGELKYQNVNSIISTKNCLFASTGNRIVDTDSGIFEILTFENQPSSILKGLEGICVYTLHEHNNKLYAGTILGIFVSSNKNSNWKFLGSSSFIEHVLSICVKDNFILAGTYNGIYKSIDNGRCWNKVSSVISNQVINAIVSDGKGIFIATGGLGVYYSEDEGNTWVEKNNGLNSIESNAFATTENEIYVSSYYSGIFQSINNGDSWQRLNNELNEYRITSIISKDNYLYASSDNKNGLLISNDKGKNWEKIEDKIIGDSLHSIAMKNNYLFACTSYLKGRIFATENHGKSWYLINSGIEDKIISSIYAFKNILLIGAFYDGTYYSLNNGKSWIKANIENLHNFSFTNLDDTIFTNSWPYAGVYKSIDNGKNWMESGLQNIQVNTIYSDNINLYAGTDNGVFISFNKGIDWFYLNQGFTISPIINSLIIFENYLFAATKYNSIWKFDLNNLPDIFGELEKYTPSQIEDTIF